MDVNTAIKIVALVCLLIMTIGGNGRFLYQMYRVRGKEHSLRRIVCIVAASSVVTGTFCVARLLLSTAAGGWILGNATCQLFGFLDLVLTSGTTFLLALASVERYFKLLIPSDHTLTFSSRNIKLLVTGLFVISILLATGPLYGLGEYSHLRGKLTLIVYEGSRHTNASINSPLHSTTKGKLNLTAHYLSVLRLAAFLQKRDDPAVRIAKYLKTEVGLIARQGRWLDEEIAFVVRAPNMTALQTLWRSYEDETLAKNLTKVLIKQNLLPFLRRDSYLHLKTFVSKDNYLTARDIHMPIEEMGICSADFTSPNRHNDVWSGYQILVTVLLPYLISFVSYCAIYRRSPQTLPAIDKTISDDDVWALNVLCSTSILCCALSSAYYAVTLSNANGFAVSKDAMFTVLYLYVSSWSVLYIVILLSNNNLLDKIRSFLLTCGVYAREAMTYELSDIEITIRQPSSTNIRKYSKSNRLSLI